MKNLFKPKKHQQIKLSSDEVNKDFQAAQRVVNEVFYPHLEAKLEQLNEHLDSKYKIRVGIEINWYFEKTE